MLILFYQSKSDLLISVLVGRKRLATGCSMCKKSTSSNLIGKNKTAPDPLSSPSESMLLICLIVVRCYKDED